HRERAERERAEHGDETRDRPPPLARDRAPPRVDRVHRGERRRDEQREDRQVVEDREEGSDGHRVASSGWARCVRRTRACTSWTPPRSSTSSTSWCSTSQRLTVAIHPTRRCRPATTRRPPSHSTRRSG